MPVPSDISELSQTAGDNFPAGSESPTTTDNYLRTYAAFIAKLRDGRGYTVEADVASAATCDLGAANSLLVRITGTTTITSFGTNYNGPRFLRFAAALTLTHNATTLVLPSGANITTVAGDSCIAIPISGGWYVTDYQRAAGTPLALADASVTAPKLSGGQTGDAPVYGARAWLNFNGITATIRASGNITSITDNGVGDFTITMTTALPDANYAFVFGGDDQGGANSSLNVNQLNSNSPTTTAFRILSYALSGTTKTPADLLRTCVAVYR